jgi:hypothetical protein
MPFFNFHLLLLDEIKEKKSFPYFMVFSRSNLPIGKDFENCSKRMSFNQRPFFDIAIELSRKKREGRDYFYFQKTWKEKRPTSSEEKWMIFLKQNGEG